MPEIVDTPPKVPTLVIRCRFNYQKMDQSIEIDYIFRLMHLFSTALDPISTQNKTLYE